MTTVGYGDYSPVTMAGRVTAVFIMAIGILTLAVVTAQVASSFVDQATRRRGSDPKQEAEPNDADACRARSATGPDRGALDGETPALDDLPRLPDVSDEGG